MRMTQVPAAVVALLMAGCGGGAVDDVSVPAQRAARAFARTGPAPVAAFLIQQQAPEGCLAPEGSAGAGVALHRSTCNGADASQRFELLAMAGTGAALRHQASGLCAVRSGDGPSALVLQPCDSAVALAVSTRDDGQGAVQVRLPHLPARAAWADQLFRLVAVPAATAWQPAVDDTWQWQLTGTVNTGYDAQVYDIDLFETPQSVIDELKASGRRVVCYFSAGSSENWRADFADFQPADMGHDLDGWAGERWLDTRSQNVRNIMKARLDHAVSRGCDGVEPDNMDGYTNDPGFALTAATQLDYNRFIAREARARGLKVGLKNAVDLLAQLEPDYDFAVNEQCHQYDECEGYAVFTSRGKPVFNAEYAAKWTNDAAKRAQLCAASRALGLRTLVLPLALDDSFRYSCD